jgi:hypothetical protein
MGRQQVFVGARGRRALGLGTALLFGAGMATATDIAEVEPNDTLATANEFVPVEIPTGAITPIGDVDNWFLTGATAGDEVYALLDVEAGAPADAALLRVLDDTGAVIITDVNDGPGKSPAVGGDAIPVDGDVFYEISEVSNDGTLASYRLFQLIADPAAVIPEVEPNDTPATATAVERQTVASGAILPDETDFFALPLESGEELAAVLDRDPDDNGLVVSTRIDILGTDGTTVLASGDLVAGDAHGVGPATAEEAGTYYVKVTHGGGGPDDDYRVAFITNVPEPAAAAAAVTAIASLIGVSRRGRARSQA